MATIDTNKNRSGEVTGYRIRACVGRDETNKQVWRTCTIPRPEGLTPKREEKEVRRMADEWEEAQKEEYKKTLKRISKDKTTLKAFIEEHWLPDHVRIDHTPSSIKFFEYTAAKATDYFGPKKKLSEIDTEDVKRYVNYLKTTPQDSTGEPFGAATVQHCFSTLRNVLRYAKRLKYIKEDPCADLSDKEKPHREKKPIDFMDSKEAKRFLACLDKEALFWKCMMHLLIATGLRRGEACGLQWGDLDKDKLTLSVVRNVTLDKSADNGLHIGKTKTGESRVVPVSQRLYDMLASLKAEREYNLSEKDENGNVTAQFIIMSNGFIFSNAVDPYRPIRPDSVTTWVRRFVEKNSLKNVSPHDLRHSAASLALEAGADLKEIQELLGHKDPSTTMKFYAGVTEEVKRRTVDGIESLIAK